MEITQQSGTATIWKDGGLSFGPKGTTTELIAFLPEASDKVPMMQYEALQGAYGGMLEIEYFGPGRVAIGRSFLAYSREDVASELGRFRDRLENHLGYRSEVQ